ncbi:MAG TPA: CarD family transcriptional regulator, partial [Acidobacteriota bacterium]|nr:CarD family transcriptional regulator [Acidobacteriota bacterium]
MRQLACRLEDARTLEGLGPTGSAMLVSAAFREWGGPQVWVCHDNRQAELFAENLRFFLPPDRASSVLIFPGIEANPYLGLSPHPEIAQRRATGLWMLSQGFQGILITTIAALASRFVAPESFLGQCVSLEMDSFFPRDHLIQMLRWMGYVREDPVSERGEFSFRGGIVDVFSPSRRYPVRIEFFGDEIESIREFDPSTQRSVQMVPACEIVPMREIVISDNDVGRWHVQAPEFWNEVKFADSLQEKLQFTENKESFHGFEYLIPLVLKLKAGLLDYLPDPPVAVFLSESTELAAAFREHDRFIAEGYEDAQLEGSLCLPPSHLFFEGDDVLATLRQGRFFHIERLAEKPEGPVESFDFRPERKYQGRFQDILKDLRAWRQKGEKVIFVTPSAGKAERVESILREYDLYARRLEGPSDLDTALEYPVSIVVGHLSEGLHLPSFGLHFLTEAEVFGESRLKASVRKVQPREALDRFLSDFRDLKPGDYVVHLEHGIGIFEGLKKIGVEEATSEFVVLKYRDDARLYVPISNLDLIQKYSSAGEAKPRIDRLGGTSWEKTKIRIKRSVRELAEDLLKLYARREVAEGYAFSQDDELMQEFEEAFEFEETPDQAAAIREVKKDMESSRPMDRLICG